MDKAAILNLVLGATTALWSALGPAFTIMVTGFFNSAVKAHIPREVQIPLAGILSAIAASLAGGDPTTIGSAATIGSIIQGALSTSPNTVLAGPKPATPPTGS